MTEKQLDKLLNLIDNCKQITLDSLSIDIDNETIFQLNEDLRIIAVRANYNLTSKSNPNYQVILRFKDHYGNFEEKEHLIVARHVQKAIEIKEKKIRDEFFKEALGDL